MVLKRVVQVMIFAFVLLTNTHFAKAAEPLLLADLGKMKWISQTMHKAPSLSEQLKEDHNILGEEINGFIIAVVVKSIGKTYTEKDKEMYEERRVKINALASSLYKKYKDTKEIQQSMREKITNQFGVNVNLINVSISKEGVSEFLEFLKSDDSKAKDYYVKKLEEKEWVPIS
jgi:hypothetical protein